MEQQGKAVVDASVGFLTTPISGESPELQRCTLQMFADIRHGLLEAHIPDRWEDELGGAIWQAVTQRRQLLIIGRPLTPEEGWAIFSELLALADTYMHWHYRDWTPDEVWAMASVKGCSYYDAIYLVLAQKLDAVFWTADRGLYEFLRKQSQL
ncbi:MAG: type II toxin-antitoxin system VapC family toxin, partial [Armatimonadota bacterium]|nr:type II toxin-antitoxin system VapC family toxin [Armatimonadota bacterium]